MSRRRLDAELVRRGLASDQAGARAAVLEGRVTVGGAPAMKPTTLVTTDAPLRLARPSDGFVSRGGRKLEAALDRFDEDPSGRRCLDAGASTGGFTERLLKRGAAGVVAVDVGYGQLAWEIRTDPRVIVLERTNVRTLDRNRLPFVPSLVVADLSFVSLRTASGPLVALGADDAGYLMLVKPQFELASSDVPDGVVRDPEAWRRAIGRVVEGFERAGAGAVDLMASPVRGPAGNVEFFMHLRRATRPRPLDIDAALAEAGRIAG